MEMVSAPMLVPEAMVPYIDNEDAKQTFERNAMILYPLIQSLTISHGKAAELLGVNKLDLIEYYNSMGLPYLKQSKEDLLEEIAEYRQYKGEVI